MDIKQRADLQLNAYFQIGMSYVRLERFERSVYPLTRCIELRPNNELYRMERAQVFQSLQLFKDAISDFNEVIRVNPKNTYAYFRRGFAYKANKQFTKAMADFERAKLMDPHNEAYVLNYWLLKNVNYIGQKAPTDPESLPKPVQLAPMPMQATFTSGLGSTSGPLE